MKLLYALLLVAVVGTLWAQDTGEPRAVEANAAYNLWCIRGPNGVCATVLDLDGRRYIRAAAGYTVEVMHDDRRAAATPLDASPQPDSKGIPYPYPDAKKGAK